MSFLSVSEVPLASQGQIQHIPLQPQDSILVTLFIQYQHWKFQLSCDDMTLKLFKGSYTP